MSQKGVSSFLLTQSKSPFDNKQTICDEYSDPSFVCMHSSDQQAECVDMSCTECEKDSGYSDTSHCPSGSQSINILRILICSV